MCRTVNGPCCVLLQSYLHVIVKSIVNFMLRNKFTIGIDFVLVLVCLFGTCTLYMFVCEEFQHTAGVRLDGEHQ